MTKHLLAVTRSTTGSLLSVPIGELALIALERLPGIRNVVIERQNNSEAELTFETDSAEAPSDLIAQLASFGVKPRSTQRVDWLS